MWPAPGEALVLRLWHAREQVHTSDDAVQRRVTDHAAPMHQAFPAHRSDLVGLGVGDVGEPAFGRVDAKVERGPAGSGDGDDDGEFAGTLAELVDGDDYARSPAGLLMAFDRVELAVPDVALTCVGDAQASAPTSALVASQAAVSALNSAQADSLPRRR